MNQTTLENWKRVVPTLDTALKLIQEKTIIALGVTPYTRILPALFLKNYQIYCTKDATDLDILRDHATIFCLEDKFPKVAAKVQATSYLLKSYPFQGFLKSRRYPYRLMFQQTTPPIVKVLEEQGIEWIGNRPESFEDVLLKAGFRDLVKELKLPHLQDKRISREEFSTKTFEEIHGYWNRAVVAQRSDFEVGGEQGTFFIRDKESLAKAQGVLSQDDRFQYVQISPLVEGPATSMLGCITHQGVLTSTLQLQFIDVPEALGSQSPTGVFIGNDWGFHPWGDHIETAAQQVVEKVGASLAAKGFKGIFGIDFIYDPLTDEIFPLECNPRFTGALPVFSLMTMQIGKVPPIEFFHLMSHLNISEPFDFEAVNKGLKERLPISHVSLSPKGIFAMKLPLAAGVYAFSQEKNALEYRRAGAFLEDIKKEDEFLMIDALPRPEGVISQNVPGFFKLIFSKSIAVSSYEVIPEVGQLLTALARALKKDQQAPEEVDK